MEWNRSQRVQPRMVYKAKKDKESQRVKEGNSAI